MTEFVTGMANGFGTILQPAFFFGIIAAALFGIVFGTIPGLSAVMAVTLFIPFTYPMTPTMGIVLLSAIYCAGVFGGSMTAVLFNIPGAPENAATCFDGYPLTQKGHAALALGTAIISSALGGIFATLTLMFTSPVIAKFALAFGPPEFFALCFLGISVVVGLGSSPVKGIISSVMGLLLACVGVSPMTGVPRLNFGSEALLAGLGIVPIMLGAFAVSEIFVRAYEIKKVNKYEDVKVSGKLFELKEFFRMKWVILRSAIIGVVIGALPGAGATIAAFISYNEAQRWSKEPEKFGTGVLEGIAAPETANNAASGGTLIPLFSLGIPGGAAAAIIVGAFQIHGLQPGPMLFNVSPEIPYTVFASLWLANLMIIVAGVLGVRALVKVLSVPQAVIFPLISIFCLVGAYAANNNIFDVWVMLIFGLVGYFMRTSGFSIPALVLGVVLGVILESSYLRTLVLSSGSVAGFFHSPISAGILILSFLSLMLPLFRKRSKVLTQADSSAGLDG